MYTQYTVGMWRLRRIVLDQGQAEIARQVGLPASYIHHYLRGREPGIDAACRMWYALGIPIEAWVMPRQRLSSE